MTGGDDIRALKKRYGPAMRAAEAEARAALEAKWSHKQGAPETLERIDRVPEHRRQSPLSRMAKLGKIDAEDLAAAEEIASVVEMIERSVSVRSGSLEARVDCSGSARDQLVESLGRIRLEVAYRAWRNSIPNPKRLIIDMVLTNTPYVRLAKEHGLHWRTARKRLISALRMWPSFKLLARHTVKRDDVEDAYARLGEGTLLAPRPKAPPPSLAEEGSE
ncbi:hypothetical protein [Sphingomonas sp.]|uniref:hypothetical protein n=1 Tax=Sphingomonas sp. TaxID=28214 RepID=UPI003BACE01C